MKFLLFIFITLATFVTAVERIEVGSFKSRALLRGSTQESTKVILLLTGSGPQGPEEIVPGSHSNDFKSYSFMNPLAKIFHQEGFHSLQLGKPGIDFFDGQLKYYHKEIYEKLTWADRVQNAQEAVDYIVRELKVKSQNIYVLGHSQGARVATDLAQKNNFGGLILLGFTGEDFESILRWQIFQREVDFFIKTDLDQNSDGWITREEAALYSGVIIRFEATQSKIHISKLEKELLKSPQKIKLFERYLKSSWCDDGHCSEGPKYKNIAQFVDEDIYIYNGALDLQTPASHALKMKKVCLEHKKENCFVKVLAGLQHCFNLPRGPRRHPLLDISLGPVENSFYEEMTDLAKKLIN